ncbi:MAG: hypothetical protein KGQ59_07580 [Bdellovibrionales bacterium]|nr:hypothetical protein [Bdellovibrionales bacterium]
MPRSRLKRNLLSLVLPLLMTIACEMQPRGNFSESQQPPEINHAELWDSITIVVRGARTQLENNGHFTTLPNACYRKESGALDVDLWNRVVLATNRLVAQQWTEETNCQDRPAGSADLYQPVVIKMMDQQVKELLKYQGSKLCSKSVDLESAAELAVLVGEVAKRAYEEGCPLARPRGRGGLTR